MGLWKQKQQQKQKTFPYLVGGLEDVSIYSE